MVYPLQSRLSTSDSLFVGCITVIGRYVDSKNSLSLNYLYLLLLGVLIAPMGRVQFHV